VALVGLEDFEEGFIALPLLQFHALNRRRHRPLLELLIGAEWASRSARSRKIKTSAPG
jgi:hypothetical protein